MAWNVSLPEAHWYAFGDPRLPAVIDDVLARDAVAIDSETTGLSVWKDRVLYWSLAWGQDTRICMPASTLPLFQDAFDDQGKRWIFANAKFDMHMFANMGFHFAGECIDTQVMHAMLYEEESHALKDMARTVLGWRWSDFFDTFKPRMVPDPEAVPKKLKSGQMNQPKRRETIQEMLVRCEQEDLSTLVEYASNDAYGTLRIYEKLKDELERTRIFSLYPETFATMADLFFKVEAPFTKVLWKCERNGIHVSAEYMAERAGPIGEQIAAYRREMVAITQNPQFNPNSTEHKTAYFFDEKKYKPKTYTKGGKSGVKKPSVDKGFLEHADETLGDPLAAVLRPYSKLTKVKSTYIDNIDQYLDPHGRIHTRYNQDTARTGRLSSSDPNLQNIPRPDEDQFVLRGAFQARPGYILLVGDYDQLEMRLVAAAAGEPDMIQIFLDGKDIHMGNAALVFGPIYEKKYGWAMTYEDIAAAKKIDGKVKASLLPPSALTEQVRLALHARQAAKNIGFGLNYGMKENNLARRLGCTKEEAVDLIDAYLARYPAVAHFYEEAIQETRYKGYSWTIFGRRRFHPEIWSKSNLERFQAERQAVNNQIQGTAADVVRVAMLRCDAARLDLRFDCHMLMQIHDELVFECPEALADEALPVIKNLMEHPLPHDLAVPLTVSLGKGHAWNTAK